MKGEALIIAVVALPFLASLVASALPRNARNAAAALAIGAALAVLVLGLLTWPAVSGGGVVRAAVAWAPTLGLDFTLRIDGFAWLFTILIAGVGLLVSVYARHYMAPEDPVPRFFSYLLGFMGSMLGIVVSGNLIQIVFFWELTSLFSFLLIGYWHGGAAAREGARTALVVTSAGGFCLLAGVLVIGHIVGGFDLDLVLAAGDRIRDHPLYLPALVLVLLGALTKSAQFPFHFWLPHAMSAPTPVSAYLHSATMVKAGVFLMVRLWPVLAGTDAWFWLVASTGLVTLLIGAYAAIFQNDLKGLLAYSTISHLGLITLLLGLGTPLAAAAAVFHIVNHAVFKASLFMTAGAVDHVAGTRDIRRLGGLARFMPWTAGLAALAAAAMAGVPLLNGFLSKEMFLAETLAMRRGPIPDLVFPTVALAASALSVAYSLRLVVSVFFGPARDQTPRAPHEPSQWMRLPIAALVLVCVAVGAAPNLTIGPLLAAASASVLGPEGPAIHLAVWHGFNAPLAMSAAAFVLGAALYVVLRPRFATRRDGAPGLRRLNGKRLFDAVLQFGSVAAPQWIERRLGAARLQAHLLAIVLTALCVAGLALGSAPPVFDGLSWSSVDPALALLWVVGGACAVGAAFHAKFHRLFALVLAGGAGLVTCITFVWLSAPDLAATQLLVEVVTAILILLGLRWLPKRIPGLEPDDRRAKFRRRRDVVIALAAGGGLATLAYGVMTHPVADSISRFFLENAYLQGGGRNVVNVILVDFRGFDTLGEITVLAAVAITVFALLRRFRPAAESVGAPVQQAHQSALDAAAPGREAGHTAANYMMIPGLIIQLMFPVILLFGVHLFLRGHDLPGGGFAAGITMSVGLILLYIAGGTRWVEQRLTVLPLRWISLGLLTAVLTGLGSLVFGRPFLTSYFRYLETPVGGRVPLATAVLFDLGVMMLVVGATTLILIALAHQSLRRPRKPSPEPAGEAPAAGETA